MSIVSHLHRLFDAETCQSYLHTLRWKIGLYNARGVRATTSDCGERTTPSPA